MSKLFSLIFHFFFHISLYFLKSCMSLIVKEIVILFLSNWLIEPVVCEINKYSSLMIPLSLYSIKYLNELCLPYCSFLATNILLTSISYILKNFFVFIIKVAFMGFFIVKMYVIFLLSLSFCALLYIVKKNYI